MVLGSFYFRRTTNGNLIGEYTNNAAERVVTESADLIGEQNESFVGDYRSTWFDGEGRTMTLEIRLKNINLNIFRLRWSDRNKNHFVGEAFLNNDMLIGVYCDEYLDEKIDHLLTK